MRRKTRILLALLVALLATGSAASGQITGGSFGGSRWSSSRSSDSAPRRETEASSRTSSNGYGGDSSLARWNRTNTSSSPADRFEDLIMIFTMVSPGILFLLVTAPFAVFVAGRGVLRSIRGHRALRRELDALRRDQGAPPEDGG